MGRRELFGRGKGRWERSVESGRLRVILKRNIITKVAWWDGRMYGT